MDAPLTRKPKSHVGKLLNEKHNPHPEEYMRNTIFLKGTKTSQVLNKAMQFLVS